MNRLKELREAKNLSQAKLAEIFEVSQQTISKYENGTREPDINMIAQLSAFFNVSSDYLLGISNNKKSNSKSASESNNRLIKDALANTGLLDKNGDLTDVGAEVIADFIKSNADMLKKLIDKK